MSRKRNGNKPYASTLILLALIAGYFFINFNDNTGGKKYEIKSVEIKGNNLFTDEEIMNLIGHIELDTLSSTKVNAIKDKLLSNIYISEAWVKIIRPAKLLIKIAEFEPVAIVLGKKKSYIAANGKLYPYRFIAEYKELPLVRGLNAEDPYAINKILTIVASINEKKVLKRKVSEIFIKNDLFELILTDNGIRVKLPTVGLHEKLYILDSFLQHNYSTVKRKKYKNINLLYNDKIICS